MGLDQLRRGILSTALPLFDTDSKSVPGGEGFDSAEETRSLLVVVLGPPGSGKGTQASLLSERLLLPHVSTGDILRDRILVGDTFGRQIASRIDVGQFVPDDWINRILDERLSLPDCRLGVILDGYPRTLSQAEKLWEGSRRSGAIVVVVRLHASPEMLTARFSGRRQCARCGALYHLRYQPSLAGDRCDRPNCDGQLEQRLDDRPEFIARRLEDFEVLTAPVITFLRARASGFVSVDAGSGNPEEVLERMVAGLAEHCTHPDSSLGITGLDSSMEEGFPPSTATRKDDRS